MIFHEKLSLIGGLILRNLEVKGYKMSTMELVAILSLCVGCIGLGLAAGIAMGQALAK